jgi:hypothetical protein
MPSIITPKRRRLTRSSSKVIDAMVDAWRWRTGATSTNTMMGLGFRCGMLRRELVHLAIEQDALPSGVVQVPRLPPTPAGAGGISVLGGMSGFTVDLEDLRQGPREPRGKKG